jgi:hypothetical protein
MRLVIGLTALALGCSSSSSSAESEGPPDFCDSSARNGLYLIHAEKVSGTCEELADQLVRIQGTALQEGCELDAPDVWRDNDCTLDRSFTCSIQNGIGYASTVGTTTQLDEAGDRLTGIATQTVSRFDGSVLCVGTYRLTYTRQ